VLGQEEERILGPTCQSVRQALIYLGILLVRPNLDILVELPEELEGEVCDLKFAK
jgi:hypothetical protein